MVTTATSARRQREVLQRRKAILDAARRLFRRRGYGETTMPQIAAEAELAVGTLYLYFPNKESLYAELLTEGYEVLLSRLETCAASKASPREAAGALIDVFFAFAREYPEHFEIMFFVLQKENDVGWAGFPEEQQQRLAAWQDSCQQVVAQVLARTRLKSPQRREHLVQAFWTMLAGVIFYCRQRESFEAVAREAKTLLLSAVFGSAGQ